MGKKITDLGQVFTEKEAIVELDVSLRTADGGDQRIVGRAVVLTAEVDVHELTATVLLLSLFAQSVKKEYSLTEQVVFRKS